MRPPIARVSGRLSPRWQRWVDRFGAWASWRHPVWLLGLLLILALLLMRAPSQAPAPSMPADFAAPAIAARVSPALDPELTAILTAARREAMSLTQQRLNALVNTLSKRVESAFLPYYLSFGRRKLEEIKAYNTFAWGWVKGLLGADQQDAAVPVLVATFQQAFETQVLTPAATRQALRQAGREAARHYATYIALALQDLQESRAVPFAQWQRYLDSLPALRVTLPEQGVWYLPLSALATPDPLRARLGEVIGDALEQRFNAWPAITADPHTLYLPDGQSIFDVGSNAGFYYGSYVVYWIFLILLVRYGWIPINLSGALVGWLVWEIFAWGTWIGWESIDFEQTRAQLEPIILQHADHWFAGLRAQLTDAGPTGAFHLLQILE
jgi:hypothetical protein